MKNIIDLMKLRVKEFIREEKAVTAVEYGLIAAATAVAIIVSLGTIKTNLAAIFASIAAAL